MGFVDPQGRTDFGRIAAIATVLAIAAGFLIWSVRAIAAEAVDEKLEEQTKLIQGNSDDIGDLKLQMERGFGEIRSKQAAYKTDIYYIKTGQERILDAIEKLNEREDGS